MVRVRPLSEIPWRDAATFGGKSANCARLKRAGFPVPDGIAISSDAAGSEAALAELVSSLAPWPAESNFAVRSSAIEEDSPQDSFAGMHETLLNVSRDRVAEAVRACWASVCSERAVAYRGARGLGSGELRTGVLVQQMVASRVSGVAFTRNPVNGAVEIVINAAPGLGEALVGGKVQPDQWRVAGDGRILSRERGVPDAATLTDSDLQELAAMAARIERLFGSPQDIEWCHDGQHFWIVQSRPITAVPTAGPDTEWTRANLREVLPDLPSPQALDNICEVLDRAERDYGGRMWAPQDELGPMARAFCGRPYFNLEQFRYAARMVQQPPAVMLRAMGYGDRLAPEDEQVAPRPWGRYLLAVPDFLRISSYQLRLGSMMRSYLRRINRTREEVRADNVAKMSDRQIAQRIDRIPEVVQQFRPIFAMSAVLMYEDSLRQLLRRVGVSYDDFALPILASGEKSVSTQQAFDLLELAALARQSEVASAYFHHATGLGDYREKLSGTEFLCQFDAYLARYGHRGRHESDWSIPRFAEDPSPLLEAIRFHVLAPACPSARTIVEEQDARAAEAWKLFESRLAARDRVITAPLVRWLLRRIKQMYLWRELYRSELVQQLSEARRWHLQVADRFLGHGWIAQRDDYFMLTFAEVCAALRGTLDANRIRELVQQRRRELDEWREIEMPMQLRESDLPRLLRRRKTQALTLREWSGLCVSPGFAEGEVVVLRAPDDFSRMKPGAIIVAPATDPAWTPLFTLASGLIVEIGGLLSHASTVAREYGLPALANVFNATSILHDGDRVRLDASGGVVELLTPAATPDPARTAFSPV